MVEVIIFRSITATTISTIITPLQVLLLTWDQNKSLVMLDSLFTHLLPVSVISV